MRFWKIEQLKSELVAGDLPPRQAYLYYVIAGAIALLLSGLPLYDKNLWDLIGTIGDAVLLVAGGYLCFRANGGSEGHDFLGRFVSLTWVVTIRVLVLAMIPVLIFVLAFEAYFLGDVPESSTPIEAVVILALEALIYWRVAGHLKSIARRSAA